MMLTHKNRAGFVVQSFQVKTARHGGIVSWSSISDTRGGYEGATVVMDAPDRMIRRIKPGDILELSILGTRLYQGIVMKVKTTPDGYSYTLDGIIAAWAKNMVQEGSYGNTSPGTDAGTVIASIVSTYGPDKSAYWGPYTNCFSPAINWISPGSYIFNQVKTYAKTTVAEVINDWNNFENFAWGGKIMNPTSLVAPSIFYYRAQNYTNVDVTVSAKELAEVDISQDIEGYGNTIRTHHDGVGGGSYGGVQDNLAIAKHGLWWKQLDISGASGTGNADANAVAQAYLNQISVSTSMGVAATTAVAEPWIKGQITLDTSRRIHGAVGVPSIFHIQPGMNFRIMGLADRCPELRGYVNNRTIYHAVSVEIQPLEQRAVVILNDFPDDTAKYIARRPAA